MTNIKVHRITNLEITDIERIKKILNSTLKAIDPENIIKSSKNL